MPRKPRIHYPGALYHVYVKGNNGEDIFREEIQKARYLELLALYKQKLGFKLYAFCVMSNHAHLLIEVKDISLSQIMQRIQQVYTQWYNWRYNRSGHVFQQRYNALLCDKESYLLQLIKYIHNNPVKANLIGGIYYKWSSHLYYLGKDGGGIVDTADILSRFSGNKREALQRYLDFMNQELEEIPFEGFEELHPKATTIEANKDIPGKENPAEELTIDEIIQRVCANESVDVAGIFKTKIQRISDIRKAIVLLSTRHCRISSAELAEKLGLSLSMISKIKSGNYKGTDYLEQVIRKWEQEISYNEVDP